MDATENVQRDLPTIRFPGQYYDDETKLHYNRFRYYDPSVGRYISADPIGQAGGVNVFSYVANAPLSRADPLGLDTAVIVGGPTRNNPFGHTALATTGDGVTSFGTGTEDGGPTPIGG